MLSGGNSGGIIKVARAATAATGVGALLGLGSWWLSRSIAVLCLKVLGVLVTCPTQITIGVYFRDDDNGIYRMV